MNTNFDALLADLITAYTELVDGTVTQNEFVSNIDTIVGDMLVGYVIDPTVLSATSKATLEDLLLTMAEAGHYTPAGSTAIDLEMDKLVSSMSLEPNIPADGDDDVFTDNTDDTTTNELTEDGFNVKVFQDLNNDGEITLDEVGAVAMNDGASAIASDATNIIGVVDLNKDGVIDAADLGDDSIQIKNINPDAIQGDDGHVKIGTLDLAAYNAYNDKGITLELTSDTNGDGHVDAADTISITRAPETTPEPVPNDDMASLQNLLATYNDYIEGDVTAEEKLAVFEEEITKLIMSDDLTAEELLLLETIVTKIVADGFALDDGTTFTDLLQTLVTGVGADVTNTSDNGVNFYEAAKAIQVAYDAAELDLITSEEMLTFVTEKVNEILVIHQVDPDAIDDGDLGMLCDTLTEILKDAETADVALIDLVKNLMETLGLDIADHTDDADDDDSDDDSSDDDDSDDDDSDDDSSDDDDSDDDDSDDDSSDDDDSDDDGSGDDDSDDDGSGDDSSDDDDADDDSSDDDDSDDDGSDDDSSDDDDADDDDSDAGDAIGAAELAALLQTVITMLNTLLERLDDHLNDDHDDSDDDDDTDDDDSDDDDSDDTDSDDDDSDDDDSDDSDDSDDDDADDDDAIDSDLDDLLDALKDLADELEDDSADSSSIQAVLLTNQADSEPSATVCEKDDLGDLEAFEIADDVIDFDTDI